MNRAPFRLAASRLANTHTDPWALEYIEWHEQRCADDIARITQWRPGAHVLNVGGAPYLFEAMAATAGLSVTTVDLAPERHGDVIAAFGINAIRADFEDRAQRLKIDLNCYDVICLCEVFEHMRHDVIGLLADIAQRMRRDARLYLTTPNFYYLPRLVSMLRQGRSGPSLVTEWRKIADIGHMGHVREYSRRELTELFEFCGLKVESISGRNSQRVPLKWRPFCSGCFAQEFVFMLQRP